MNVYKNLSAAFAVGLSFVAYAHSPNDHSLDIYPGLQDYDQIFSLQGFEPDTVLGEIKNKNYEEELLAPWNETWLNQVLTNIPAPKDSSKIQLLIKDVFTTYQKELAGSTNDVSSSQAFIANRPQNLFHALDNDEPNLIIHLLDNILTIARLDRYFLSGTKITREKQLQFARKILSLDTFSTFSHDARAITVTDAHASFLPSKEAITNDLAGTANTGSDQKTSSSFIPANTPLYVLGQLNDDEKMTPEDSSWLIVWRPEFGIKFVRSEHVALLSAEDIEIYKTAAKDSVELVASTRLSATYFTDRRRFLRPGTPILRNNDQFLTAISLYDNQLPTTPHGLKLYHAYLTNTHLAVKDSEQELADHIRPVSHPFTVAEYQRQLHLNTFDNPWYVRPNENKPFAWGEAPVGPDNYNGQDVSNFIRKVLLQFGINLPRYSGDQIIEGLTTNPVYGTLDGFTKFVTGSTLIEDKLNDFHQALVDHCNPGYFTSFGAGSHAACLGSITWEQLNTLDSKAAQDAIEHGNMTTDDRIPLLALSPVGLKASSGWYITGKTAVYPVFKSEPHNAWVSRANLFIYSYFK
ncbi:hypothetical protein EOPP23_08395 [Endozoicomonas sp. OPT23]|uniref:hypothetical protein n=1 Tax=Endozoicomonas sp. OPT23 TaxID=2072845 RepID=UPI00129ABE43|nr:hypothetical protein [Endozoicomonas sp. OPT23]MRI33000.1 hypothetical protein [Endozoicomonas sp. OPT23]